MYPNSPNIRLKMLTIELVQNEIGYVIYHFRKLKEVIGINFSISSREYYVSKKQDIHIDISVKIQSFIYDDSKYVDVSYTIYKVERTYLSGQFLELYLSKTSVRKSDIVGYT